MKKLFTLIAIAGMLSFGAFQANAQDNSQTTQATKTATAKPDSNSNASSAATTKKAAVSNAANADANNANKDTKVAPKKESFHEVLKEKFIEGGPGFMGIVLVSLILGLAIAIERVIYLNLATTNSEKLLNKIEDAMNDGGVDAAKEICRNTKGPVASIFYQGLDRSHEGIDVVEKTVISYGSVQMGLLEKGISWISLFIALAPMLGFLGTVIGMIEAFDAIQVAGNISPSLVAGGIKVALLTTVFGLIVAMILQLFYNYIIAKVDSIVNDMENASISLVDILVKNELKNKK